MPAALERKLKKEASKKGFKGEKKDSYVYGTLRKTGWKPEQEKKMSDESDILRFGYVPGEAAGRISKMWKDPLLSGSMQWKRWLQRVNLNTAKIKPGPSSRGHHYASMGAGRPITQTLMKYSDTSKLVRLTEIGKNLDSVIKFAYDDEETNKRSALGTGALVGGAAATGVGGTLAHQAISSTGGYAKNWSTGVAGLQRGWRGAGLQGVAKTAGRGWGHQLGMALSRLKPLLAGARLMSSKDETIQFDEHLLEPWGDMPKTKIIQEDFPAGLSPAAVLRFPFPKLMRYLNRPNQLQQQWSGFSKKEKLIELQSKVDSLIGA